MLRHRILHFPQISTTQSTRVSGLCHFADLKTSSILTDRLSEKNITKVWCGNEGMTDRKPFGIGFIVTYLDCLFMTYAIYLICIYLWLVHELTRIRIYRQTLSIYFKCNCKNVYSKQDLYFTKPQEYKTR